MPVYHRASTALPSLAQTLIAGLLTLALLSLGFYSVPSFAKNQKTTAKLPTAIEVALDKALLPRTAFSAYVVAVGEKMPRLSWRAQVPMNPASTMKLVTTWSALQLLGPTYRWSTSIYADQLPVNGLLRSDIYIRGGGDPKLVPEELDQLIQRLRQAGVETIDGNLVLDKSLFIAGPNADQTIDGEVERAYNVTPDPLLYAFKTLFFDLNPSPTNDQITINARPPLAQLQIDNQLINKQGAALSLTQSHCALWQAKVKRQENGIVRATFNGDYPSDCGNQKYQIALLNHSEFFWGGFVSAWQNAGGHFTHPPMLREAAVPSNSKLLAEHIGLPLQDIITDINKYSNNVMARQLFLTLGTKLAGVPAYVPSTALALKQWLSSQELSMPELLIENGSGLSRAARISAAHLATLLEHAEAGPLIKTLPIVGVDGTMKHRLNNSSIAGNAWIKTGTLKDVCAIAGYVQAKDGKKYIVVSMINHENTMSAGRQVLDTLLEWVYEGPSDENKSAY